jgi:radical SAM superfamily enzyme YgiQ (UPF0313 family)
MKILYLPDQYSQQRQREKPAWVYPVRLAMEATKDIRDGHDVVWNPHPSSYWWGMGENGLEIKGYDEIVTKPRYTDFLSLPVPDRVVTGSFDKRYQVYGNAKYNPFTLMQVADGCWWGRCCFCVENKNIYKVRSLSAVMHEIDECEQLGFREIFDDSGAFPDGKWCDDFCLEKILRGLSHVKFGCNLRMDSKVDFGLMKKAGFRMILIGVESANQPTLDMIKKGTRANEIIPFFKEASRAGLEPHCAVMFGFPWETKEEESKTLELVHFLLRKGYAKTAQASVYTIHGRRGLDRGNVKRIYEAAYHPDFWYHQIRGIKEWADFTYLLKGIRKGIFHD